MKSEINQWPHKWTLAQRKYFFLEMYTIVCFAIHGTLQRGLIINMYVTAHGSDFYLGCKWCKCFAGETICYESSCIDNYATAAVKSQFTGILFYCLLLD